MKDISFIRLLVNVSNMYYFEELNQETIASKLGISRSQVSRLITQAKKEGIVKITINNPLGESNLVESQIQQRFNLQEALVIDYPADNESSFYNVVAEQSGELFNRYIKDHDVIAVSAGKTLSLLSNSLAPINRDDLTIVTTGGGMTLKESRWQSNSIVSTLSNKWSAKEMILNSPSYVSQTETRDALLKEKDIIDTLNLAKNADVVITGLGVINRKEGTLLESHSLSRDDIEELISKKAVLSCCGSFVDIEGNEVTSSCQDKSINVKLDEFKPSATVIAIAFGTNKVKSITAALRTGKIDVLITDLKTAKMIIEE